MQIEGGFQPTPSHGRRQIERELWENRKKPQRQTRQNNPTEQTLLSGEAKKFWEFRKIS
jgi:hypothetical protein